MTRQMTQQSTNRLALSYITQFNYLNTQKCLSCSHPQCVSCCNHTATTRSTILTKLDADLNPQAPKTHSPAQLRPRSHRKKRQEIQGNLHRSNMKWTDQKTPTKWRSLQQTEQRTKLHHDQQPKVSSLTLPRSILQHRPQRSTSPPAHRPTPNSTHTNRNKTPSKSSNKGEKPTTKRNNQPRHEHQKSEWTAAAQILRSPDPNRTPRTQIARRKQMTTKYHQRQRLNTQCMRSQTTTGGLKNLQEITSRHWNPNRSTTIPSPTNKDDRKHRIAETQQDKRLPQLPSSKQHPSLLCLSTHLSPLCFLLLRHYSAPGCRRRRHCSDNSAANARWIAEEASNNHHCEARHRNLTIGHTHTATDCNPARRHQPRYRGRPARRLQLHYRGSPARQHQRPRTRSSHRQQTPRRVNDNCRIQLGSSTIRDNNRHLEADGYWHQTTTSNIYNKRTRLQRSTSHPAQHRIRRANTYRRPTSLDKNRKDNNIEILQNKPPNREGKNASKQERLHTCKSVEEPRSSGANGKQPNTNGRIANSLFTAATPVTRPPHQYRTTPGPPQNHSCCKLNALLPHSTILLQQPHDTNHLSKYPPNLSFLKQALPYTWHNNFNTLSYTSNPKNAWETYASRRALACISKAFVPHAKYLCKTKPHGCQPLDSSYTLNKNSQPYHILEYSIHLCLQIPSRIMTGNAKPNTRHHSTNNANEVVMEEVTPPSKRASPNTSKASHKKSKSIGTTISLYRDPSQMEFWYGYPTMETIAYEAGIPLITTTTPIEELIALGYVASEAAELRSASMSFPRVQQKLWPTTRPDGIEGQHINITQLPFDIEVNPKTNLSLDYHILLHFEKPTTPFSQDQIMKKLLLRFQTMEIQLGDLIGEPIAVLCHGPKTARVWSGMAKIHLKNPNKDGIALLSGRRIFAISLDNDTITIAKVAKSYDSLASSNLLTVKINTDNIRDLLAHQLFKTVVEESFKRGHEFELAQVQKIAGENYGWLITTSPEQVEKIGRHKIPILGELLTPVISSGDQLSRDDVVRRNCLVLLAKGLNLTKLIEPTTASLHAHFGTKNIVSVFYPRATSKIHHGVANVECLNSAVYKQHLNKSVRLQNKWVMFHPHPNSLDGSARPDEDTLKKLGFSDVNNALADTIEALKNAPGPSQPPINKTDIATLVKDVVSQENNKLRTEFKADMTLLRTDMSTEAKSYADQINFELRSALTNLEQVLGQSMQVVKNLVRPPLPSLDQASQQPN